MNEEEKKAIEYLKLLEKTNIFYDKPPSTNRCNIGGAIYILLNLIEKQDKIIDLMAKEMKSKEYEYEDMCLYSEDCHGEYCEQCIKEYFRKKVKND